MSPFKFMHYFPFTRTFNTILKEIIDESIRPTKITVSIDYLALNILFITYGTKSHSWKTRCNPKKPYRYQQLKISIVNDLCCKKYLPILIVENFSPFLSDHV